MSLQKSLEALKPYVVGIRFVEGIPIVDAVFKDGWQLPESKVITKTKGTDELNYYMLYSELPDIGVDELLKYVETTIKVNIEREKKHELLYKKVEELKEIFKKNSLAKLVTLKFVFPNEELVPALGDINLDPEPEQEEVIEQVVEKPQVQDQLTEEELEMLEEERRAENFKKIKAQQKTTTKKISQKIELPPKRELMTVPHGEPDCNCGPNEACEKCIEYKDL